MASSSDHPAEWLAQVIRQLNDWLAQVIGQPELVISQTEDLSSLPRKSDLSSSVYCLSFSVSRLLDNRKGASLSKRNRQSVN